MKLMREFIVIMLLVILIFSGLILRNFPFNQGNFDKNMPPVITSYDLFANIDYASWIYESEDARYYHSSRIFGIKNSLVQQPIFFHVFIATFGKIMNLHPFQTTTLVTNILSILIILVIFIIIRRIFNPLLAVLTAAFSLVPNSAVWFFQMNIGFMYDYYAFLFVPAILFFILISINQNYSKKESLLLGAILGSFISSQWLAHFVELFVFTPFFVLTILYLKYKNNFFINVKFFFISLISTFLPFFIYFYTLARKAHLGRGVLGGIKDNFKLGQQVTWPDYFPHFTLSTLLFIFLMLGILILFYLLVKKNSSIQKKIFILFMLYLFTFGYSYNIGVNEFRSIRQLFNGYSFIFFIVCLGIYYCMLILFKKEASKILFYSMIIISILPLFIYFNNVYLQLQQMDASSFINDEKWNALIWIKENINDSDFVFYLNGYFHEVEMLAGKPYFEGFHLPAIEYWKRNILTLCQGNYPDNYYGWWGAAEYHPELGGYIKSRKGLFDFEMIMPLQNLSPNLNYTFTKDKKAPDFVPLKFFDYVVLQYTNTEYDQCMHFFIDESIKRGHKLIWKNVEVTILKINKTLEI